MLLVPIDPVLGLALAELEDEDAVSLLLTPPFAAPVTGVVVTIAAGSGAPLVGDWVGVPTLAATVVYART